MHRSIWELCHLDSETLALIDQIQPEAASNATSTASRSNLDGTPAGSDDAAAVAANNSIYGLQDSIVLTEKACRESMTAVDELLGVLNEISVDYQDVTGRTNSLMMNCENLLEQQVSIISVIKMGPPYHF
jgi:hypothetical protein